MACVSSRAVKSEGLVQLLDVARLLHARSLAIALGVRVVVGLGWLAGEWNASRRERVGGRPGHFFGRTATGVDSMVNGLDTAIAVVGLSATERRGREARCLGLAHPGGHPRVGFDGVV